MGARRGKPPRLPLHSPLPLPPYLGSDGCHGTRFLSGGHVRRDDEGKWCENVLPPRCLPLLSFSSFSSSSSSSLSSPLLSPAPQQSVRELMKGTAATAAEEAAVASVSKSYTQIHTQTHTQTHTLTLLLISLFQQPAMTNKSSGWNHLLCAADPMRRHRGERESASTCVRGSKSVCERETVI